MRLRRYCVTVADHWTPLRYFWTLDGAEKFWIKHRGCAYIFRWKDGRWISTMKETSIP